MGKYDDLFDATPSPSPTAVGKYSDLFDEPGVTVTQSEGYAPSFGPGTHAGQLVSALEPDLPRPYEDLPPELARPDEEETLGDRIRKFLFEPEGAQTTREAIQGAVESIPELVKQLPKQAYQGVKFATGGPEERMQVATEALREGVPMGIQTAEDIQAPFGTPEFLRGAGQLGMMATPGLELARELRAPVEIPREVPPIEAPPVQVPPPPIGTPLKPVPLLGPQGTTAADVAAAQVAPPPPVTPAGAPVAEVPEPYTPEAAAARAAQPQPATTQTAPIGAANRIARAREQTGLTEAPPSGIGIGWHESVSNGNALIDKGADAYKVVSDFQKTGDISGEKMSVARAWLERLQRANQEARGALEQNPANPDLQRTAVDAEAAENAFWQGYQPMKTEWSKIGTGMQEQRGITDTDLLSQKTAEQVMREHIDRELTAADKARAAKAVKDTRQANANVDAAFDKAIGEASRKAKGPPRSLEQLKNDLAAKLKELTPC